MKLKCISITQEKTPGTNEVLSETARLVTDESAKYVDPIESNESKDDHMKRQPGGYVGTTHTNVVTLTTNEKARFGRYVIHQTYDLSI